MGRGRVQLRRIENKINRQVTFSKRRCGLLKKANEISILCDAEVALIIFSTKGKLYEYSTDSSMEKIIDRYERYCYAGKELGSGNSELEGSWNLEFLKLKSKVESLQKGERYGNFEMKSIPYSFLDAKFLVPKGLTVKGSGLLELSDTAKSRNLMGNDLDSLNPKELNNLEQQLESGLKKIRAQKNNLLCDSVMELQTKEKTLRQQNNALEKKLKIEKAALAQRAQLHQQNPKASYSSSTPSFGAVEPLPNLNLAFLL